MKDASSDFATAMLTGEHVLVHQLLHDWDNDGPNGSLDDITRFVAEVSITQELTSQLPAQARIIEGGTAAELTAQLERGNLAFEDISIAVKAVTTASSGNGVSDTVTITRPTSVEGDIIIIFIAVAGATTAVKWMPLTLAGEEWYAYLFRGDTSPTTRIEGYGLARRVNADEDTTYEFPLESSLAWTATAVTLGDPGAVGLCALITKGQDDDLSAATTTLELPDLDVPRDGCVILSGFAASVTVTGASWTPLDGDIELSDLSTNRGSSAQNSVMGVQVATDVDAGSHAKRSTLSVSATSTVAFAIALSHYPAGNELQHAGWTFSELNSSGPYIGKVRTYRRMYWDVGLLTSSGQELVRMFTGRSLATDGSSRGRNHTIIALDERETMKSPFGSGVPNVLGEELFVSLGETLPRWPGLEITWVVSLLFLRARDPASVGTISQPEDQGYLNGYGYFASPNPRRSNTVHVSCHGSLHPWFTNNECLYAYTETSGGIRRRVMFWDGPYVAATEQAPHEGGSIRAKWNGVQFTGFNVGAIWSSVDQTAGRIEFCGRFFVSGAGGVITLTLQGDTAIHNVVVSVTQGGNLAWSLRQNGGATRSAAGPAVPADTEWHWFGFHWNSTTGQVIFAIDGVETTGSFAVLANNTNTDDFFELVMSLTNGAQIAEIHVDNGIQSTSGETSTLIVESTDPWLSDFIPNAFIDKSDTLLDAVLYFDPDLDPWEILQEIARSDFASVYFDSQGRLRWRNGRSDASDEGQTIVRELTARDSLMDLDYTSGAAQIANSVSVSYTPVEYVIDGEFYRPTGAIKVPANSSIVVTFVQPGPIIRNASFSDSLTAANTAADGSGTSVTVLGFVSASFSIGGFGNQFGTVTFDNLYSFDVWIVDTSGQPSYSITASWVEQAARSEPVTSSDDDSKRRYRVQPLAVGSTIWRQREDAAQTLAEQLVGDLAKPRPTIRNVRIIGDPRLELGDLTNISDEGGLGLDASYRLSGISSQLKPTTGFTQRITARAGQEVAVWDEDDWDGEEIWG